MRLDSDEVIFLALLQKRNSLRHQRVSDNDARLGFSVILGGIEGCHDSIKIVAVDALHEPTKGLELGDQWFESQHLC